MNDSKRLAYVCVCVSMCQHWFVASGDNSAVAQTMANLDSGIQALSSDDMHIAYLANHCLVSIGDIASMCNFSFFVKRQLRLYLLRKMYVSTSKWNINAALPTDTRMKSKLRGKHNSWCENDENHNICSSIWTLRVFCLLSGCLSLSLYFYIFICHNFSPFHHIYYSFSFSFVVRQALFFLSSSIVFSEIRELHALLYHVFFVLRASQPQIPHSQHTISFFALPDSVFKTFFHFFCPERRVLTLVLTEKNDDDDGGSGDNISNTKSLMNVKLLLPPLSLSHSFVVSLSPFLFPLSPYRPTDLCCGIGSSIENV